MSSPFTRRHFLCSSGMLAGGLMAGWTLSGLNGEALAQAAPPVGTPEVTQDYTSSAYQKTVDQRVALNQRIIHVSITNQGSRVCYKATWSATDGPPWMARHGLTGALFQAQLDDAASQGYRPIELCAYVIESTPYFGGLWEQTDGPDFQVSKDLGPADFAARDKSLTDQGYHLAQSCKYTAGGKPLALGLWRK